MTTQEACLIAERDALKQALAEARDDRGEAERSRDAAMAREAAVTSERDRWEKQARMMAIVADRHKAHATLLDAIIATLKPTAENVARLYEKVKDTQSQVWRLLRVIDGEIRDHLGLEQEEIT